VVPYLGDEDGMTQLARAVAGMADAFDPPLCWEAVADHGDRSRAGRCGVLAMVLTGRRKGYL
jgi:hypothetical protein